MDFKDSILQFAARVDKLCSQIKTEEATKNALIMPFIQLLGYDVFNPFEVSPEFIADIGIKKGEKVDYAILNDSKPILLIECKHYTEDLNPHNSQLFRYFHTTDSKFALLTNGLCFKFYTDLVAPNKMDEKPFFEFNITEIKDNEIAELKKFHKSYFDVENITNTASELKYLNEMKTLINKELVDPSEDFVRLFTKKVYPNAITQKVLEQFTAITKKTCAILVSDIISERLKSALQVEVAKEERLTEVAPEAEVGIQTETTQDEIDGFLIIKSILRQKMDVKRIFMRDAQSYCAILFDDNNRKPICRFHFNGKKLALGIPDSSKNFQKNDIAALDDIYSYSDELLSVIEGYK
jgi:predicted type IV restriction endonuclease